MDDKTKIKILEQKLKIAKDWMKKEVEKEKRGIQEGKKEIKKIVTPLDIMDKINSFFPEVALINVNDDFFDNLISSEIHFANLKNNPDIDGSSVIIWYNKILDSLIESTITKNYRKYALKSKIILRENDPLEKALHLTVTKGYIIWLWRLFWILERIKNWKKIDEFLESFKHYLDKNSYIKEVILSESFFTNFEKIIKTEIFWRKRHVWTMHFEEVKKIRKLLLWDFKDKNCILYKLIELKNTF